VAQPGSRAFSRPPSYTGFATIGGDVSMALASAQPAAQPDPNQGPDLPLSLEEVRRFPDPPAVPLVFSAHGVPVSVIEKGDPYQRQIEETVSLVMEQGGWSNDHRLCYQSKVGASRWLEPSLRQTLREAASEKRYEVCVVPISFVSDHVETLGEIDHCAREEARLLGIERFEMTRGLNDSPKFIQALAASVMAAIGETESEGSGQERELAAHSMAAD